MRTIGKFFLLTVTVVMTTAMTTAATKSLAVECTEPDLLGIVWENGEFTYDAAPGIITGTIYLFNPTRPSISGYEMLFTLPPNLAVVEWAYRGQAVNIGQPPELTVGLANPLFPDAENRIALVDITVFVFDTAQADFFVGPTSIPSLPGEIVYVDGEDPGLLIPMDPVSGSFDLPIARLNGPFLPWCEGGTNQPPVVSDIPDQTIGEGQIFTAIDLNVYVFDPDNPDNEISWAATGNVELAVSIVGNIATVSTPDPDWNGSETIAFTATDPGGLSDSDAATFTVTAINDPPVVSDIPDQIVNEGSSFAAINLNDYVTDVDNLNSEISWIATGNVELGVSILDSIATIAIPDPEWSGSEAITFIASDPGQLSDSDSAIFTVLAVNDPPVVSDIPDQVVPEGSAFEVIPLAQFVSDIDNPVSEITWSATGQVELAVDIVGQEATVVILDPDWNGSEAITFTATDPGGLSDSDVATFTVTPVNDPPVVLDIPDQVIDEGAAFAVVDLNLYVTDVDNLDSEIGWAASGNVEIDVVIVDNIATLTPPDPDWNGSEVLTFTATDPGLLSDFDSASFTVLPVNDPPVVSDIPDQEIAEGGAFAVINLNDYVADIDNLDGEMSWVATGNTELTVTIVDTIATVTTPDPDWNGNETITFTATDPGELSASDSATFTVTPVNDAPVVLDIPDQTIEEGNSFATILLDEFVTDIDNLDSEMSWLASGNTEIDVVIVDNIATLTSPNPDWSGSETITFTATDPGELSDSDDAVFTVLAVNDPPDAVDDEASVTAGEAVVIEVLANDSDPEDDPLTVTSVTDGSFGTVTTDGLTVTYTHDGGDSTTDSFLYYIHDGNAGTDSATVTINVNQVFDFYVEIAAQGDLDNRAGVMPGATDGYDQGIDQEEDPVGSHVWFPHLEWDAPVGPNFQWDVKAPYDPLDGLKVWNFVVEETNNSSSSVLVTVTFVPTFSAADGIDLVLRDLETDEVLSLFPDLQYAFTVPPFTTLSRSFELSIGQYGWSEGDTDGDGVADLVDACPGEDASFFDGDGDGCIDPVIGARHIEYWSLDDLPLTYVINQNGAPGITDGSDFTAIEAGFATWAQIPGVQVTVDYQGTTPQADAQAMDLVNLVTFNDPDYVFPAGVLAVGLSTSFLTPVQDGEITYRPGQIIDSDQILNPAFSFRTATMGEGTDIQSIVTHEAGHMLGISHSAVLTSTMSYVLRPNDDAASLTIEDELVMLKAYPDPGLVEQTNHLRGTVTDGLTGDPVPGVIVFAMDTASGDTVVCDYTLPSDGSYHFIGIPDGNYYVAIHPLDGSSAINFIQPGNINQLVNDTAVTLVVPEYYDQNESNSDNPADMTEVSVGDGGTAIANIITNVDLTGPTVVAVTPASDALDVAIDAAVAVRFSEAIDGGSLSGNFSLDVMGGGGLLPGNAALVEDGRTLVYVPVQSFQFETVYQLELGDGIQDLFGNSMGTPTTTLFTTQLQPPVSLASLVPRKGAAGSVIVINGEGFAADPAQNEVSFGGTILPISQVTPSQAVVEVPTDAVPGNVEVTLTNLNLSETSTPLTFTVLEPEEIATGFETATVDLFALPRTLEVSPDGDHVYIATATGLSAVDVSDPSSPTHTPTAIEGGLNSLDVTPDGQNLFAVSSLGEKLFRFQANPISLLSEITLDEVPRGVLLSLSGRRAYLAMDTGEIQIWDVDPASATFENQIGSLTSPDPNLLGKMVLDPAGNYLFALGGTGKLLVFDPMTETLLHAVPVMTNPSDVVMDPAGQVAYVTSGDGYLSVVSLTSFTNLLDVPTGGKLKGAAVTATGSFVWAANRLLNFLDVIDLRQGSPTYLGIATRISQRVNPVDVGFSPDGIYAYSIVETEQKLVITAKGEGPVLASLSRRAGPIGTRMVLSGAGFTGASVSFNGVDAIIEAGSETMLTVLVPEGASSGPVTVVGAVPGEISNTLPFEVLGASAPGGLRLAATVRPAGSPQLTDAIAVAGDGELVAVGGADGRVHLLDNDPDSPDFNQFVAAPVVLPTAVDDIAISPDDELAFVVSGGDPDVPVLDIDPDEETFGQVIRTIALDAGAPASVAVSPGGDYLLVADPDLASVHLVNLANDVVTTTSIQDALPGLNGQVGETAFHPGGDYAYLAVRDADPAAVVVLNTDPDSEGFGTIAGSVFLPADGPSAEPLSLDFSPDGDSCYVLRSWQGEGDDRLVEKLDTSLPSEPINSMTVNFPATAAPMDERLRVAPAGDRAILNVRDAGFYLLDLASFSQVNQPDIAADGEPLEFAFGPDGSQMYLVSTQDDVLSVFDFQAEQRIGIIWGNGQTGIIGEPLDSSLRVRVTDVATGQGTSGVPVTFDVLSGGGHFITDDPLAMPVTLTVSTGTYGYGEVDLNLGPSEGIQQVQAAAVGVTGSPVTFTATATVDPETLPLTLVENLLAPPDGDTEVSVTTAVQATFSRAVNPATVTSTSFYLSDDGGATRVPTILGFASGNRKVSLTPVTELAYSTTYTLIIGAAISDLGGGPLQNPQQTTFTTEAPPPVPELDAISPTSGAEVIDVVLSGSGFDPVPSLNEVWFGSVQATITGGATDFLNVSVPLGATTGEVFVVSGGQPSNALIFTVLIPSTSPPDEVLAQVGTGSPARSVTISPDGVTAYAVSPDADLIIPLVLETLTTLPGIPVGDQPWAITIHPDGAYAYVANRLSGDVSVINLQGSAEEWHQVVATMEVGLAPVDVVVTPGGDRVIVANSQSNDLSIIDSNQDSDTFNSVIASVGTGSASRSVTVSPDGARIYVGTDNGYLVLDSVDFGVLAGVGTGSGARTVTISPDGALLVFVDTQGDILIFDVAPGSDSENQVLAGVGTGSGARVATISPDGALLYVVPEESDVIEVYALDIGTSVGVLNPEGTGSVPALNLVSTLLVGEDPQYVAFEPQTGSLLVPNAGDNTISVIVEEGTVVALDRGAIAGQVQVDCARSGPGLDEVTIDAYAHGSGTLVGTWQANALGAFEAELVPGDYLFTLLAPPGFATTTEELPATVDGGGSVTLDWFLGCLDAAPAQRSMGYWKRQLAVALGGNGGAEVTEGALSEYLDVIASRFTRSSVNPVVVYEPPPSASAREKLLAAGTALNLSGTRSVTAGARQQLMAVLLNVASGKLSLEDEISQDGMLVSHAITHLDRLLDDGEQYNDGLVLDIAQQINFGQKLGPGVIPLDTPDITYSDQPSRFFLGQSYPNPFNPSTTIKFEVARTTEVRLKIYDVAGRLVRTLVDEVRRPGIYTVVWDGTNDRDRRVASGLYFYRFEADQFVSTRKMMLLK